MKKMRRFGALGIVVAVVAGAYFAGYITRGGRPTAVAEAGLVGFEPARADLGALLWDTTVPFEFIFANGGARSVVIELVKSSCNCLILDADAYRGLSVEPADCIQVSGSLKTGKHAGSFVRTITVRTDSGEEYPANLLYDVYGTWSISLDTLDLGEVVLGDPESPDAEQAFQFVARPDDLVGEPRCTAPWLRCIASKRDAVTTDILVRVLKDKLPLGVNTADIDLQTTSPVRPDTSVYVRVRAVPALVTTPVNVFLVGNETKRVKVTDRDGQPVRLVRAQTSTDEIRATVVGDAEVEVANVSGSVLKEATSITVEDARGRSALIVVTTFES